MLKRTIDLRPADHAPADAQADLGRMLFWARPRNDMPLDVALLALIARWAPVMAATGWTTRCAFAGWCSADQCCAISESTPSTPVSPMAKCVCEMGADYRDKVEEFTGISLRECPACHHGRMVCIEVLERILSSPPLSPDTS